MLHVWKHLNWYGGPALTIRVLDCDGVSHDWVAHAVLVLSADSELILMSFDEFLH